MSSKKKLIISLSVVAAVILAAVIAIVAVFAATTQNVASNIRVRYTAQEGISGTATANYYYFIKDETAEQSAKMVNTNVNDDKQDGTTLKFWVTDTNYNPSLSPENEIAVLADDGKDYVIFEYNFQNTGENIFYATLDWSLANDAVLGENYEVSYSLEKSGVYTPWADAEGYYITVAASDGTNDPTNSLYVKVELPESKKGVDSFFSAEFAWALTLEAPADATEVK